MKTRTVLIASFALALAAGSAVLAGEGDVQTRFGTLSVGKDRASNWTGPTVLWHGRALHPTVRGNNAIFVKHVFALATEDVILFEDDGGTACPQLWHLVAVSKSGVSSTGGFGTCGPLLGLKQRGQTIVVSTRGFQGPFEPEAARNRAEAEIHTFVYARGVVTEHGKAVPFSLE